MGSLKEKRAKDMPSHELIKQAVGGMLPKNTHRPRALKRLKIFEGSTHKYEDKKPSSVVI
ncbi:MAG: uL13 family ribosomal protein [Oligoflexia bacterium]|nr:uL13 family ribosomal protein [Oligoflexia bacterium]